jgi:hypothetical protein
MTRAADVDVNWLAGKLNAGFGWSAIARMAGCSEVDLRRLRDPAVAAADWMRRPANPREIVRDALVRRGFTGDEALILSRLWQGNGARIRSRDLAAGIVGGDAAREVCREAKRRAWEKGIEFAEGAGGYALAPAGLLKISDWAGLRGRP